MIYYPILGININISILSITLLTHYFESEITIVLAFLECTSLNDNFISFKLSSSIIINIIAVDFYLLQSIKANGPCFNSPAQNASAWI